MGGLLNTFRNITKDSRKITFIGTPGFCTPFAEILAYVIRDTDQELAFIPNISVNKAKTIISTPHGMQLGEDTNPSADTIVLLGGLAIPKMNIDVNDVKKVIEDISEPKDRKVIGVCFMSMFQETGWIDIIEFDYLLDSYLKITSMEN
ncbi:MAG TPA: DUF2124 domain-containing protein [archaeon]|nr:DUF2124 domain-containing protein [archaeon]